MRRRAVIAPIVLLAGALLAWRRRRARDARPPLEAAPVDARRPAPALPAPPPPADSPFVSVPWALAGAPEDRAELRVRYAAHPLLELDRVDAQETPTQVFVTVLMRRRAAATDDGGGETAPECEATVALSGPLGARELVHAPADGEPNAAPV